MSLAWGQPSPSPSPGPPPGPASAPFGAAQGQVLGAVGGGLEKAAWLGAHQQGAARVGLGGEQRTAAVLNKFAGHGVTVMHDLMCPSDRYRANIDHLIVSGTSVWIIDSKVWKPGRYWTVGRRTYRGWRRFVSVDHKSGKKSYPAEKKTMDMAADLVDGYLTHRGIEVMVEEPLLVVWPSSDRERLRLGMIDVPGAHTIHANRLEKWAASRFTSKRATPADPRIVAALTELLVTKPKPTPTPVALATDIQPQIQPPVEVHTDPFFGGF